MSVDVSRHSPAADRRDPLAGVDGAADGVPVLGGVAVTDDVPMAETPRAPHSPLPWQRDEYGAVLDANGRRVNLTNFGLACGPRNEQAESNGDLAFAAVNAHAALVAERDDLSMRLVNLRENEGRIREHYLAVNAALVEALKELRQSSDYVLRSHGHHITGTAKLIGDLQRADDALKLAGVE